MEIIRKKITWRVKYPAKMDLKSRWDWDTASKCEKKTRKNIPGIYHFSIRSNSSPAPSHWPNLPENKKRKRTNTALIALLSNSDEDATEVFSTLLLPTYFMWAFFKRLDFAVSNNVVTTKKNAQTPISGFDRLRMRIIKFKNPKSVTEKRWRMVNSADRIQYEERYFFKGVASFRKNQTYTKISDINILLMCVRIIDFWFTLQPFTNNQFYW